MSANSASCTPPAPMMAGPSALRNFRVGSSSRGMRSLMPMPCVSASPPTTSTMIDAGHEHAPGGGVAGVGEERRQQQRGDDRQIEQDGRAGGGGEPVIGIEDAGEQRLHRHQREIGKGDAGERHGEIVARRIVVETRRQQADHLRGEDQREREQHEIDGDQRRGDLVGEQLGGGEPSLLEGARISGHEGRGERPFGEDGAEMVGQPEGDEEGVGHGPGAQHRRHDHVADEAR